MVVGVTFSFAGGLFTLVGDFDSLLRSRLDMADAGLEYGADTMPLESSDCRRLLLTGMRDVGESLRKVFRVPELGGVGYSAGTACALKFGILGAVDG
jgi:hypothetical protein